MSPVTHFLMGWVVANSDGLNRRERATVTLASIAPDIDGLGAIAEKLTRGWDRPLLWFSEYHHVLAHNLGCALLVAAASFMLATRRWKTAALAFLSFHLHLLGDLVGGRGPDGYQWPIPYLIPFSNAWQWSWQGQWELDAWPNFVITGVLLAITFYLAWKRGYSPLEMVSTRADRAFVETLRHRFPYPRLLGH
ncbi:MAG: metal-dependent hydrolase [Candidatus Methylomirabilales bacterium]